MKKVIVKIAVLVIAWILAAYLVYYSIFKKMTFKLEGFSIRDEAGAMTIKEKIAVKLLSDGFKNISFFKDGWVEWQKEGK